MVYSRPLVRALVLHFLDLAGWEGEHALITLSKKTFDRAASRYGLSGAQPNGYLGHTIVEDKAGPERYPVIWINPSITSFQQLSRVCAHEALHAARPLMRHGRPFEKAVTRMLKGQDPNE